MDPIEEAKLAEKWLCGLAARVGPDPMVVLLSAASGLPADWAALPPAAGFQRLRCRLKFTQQELSEKSGVAQAQISRLEGGGDALLSTWRRLYEAMGFQLVLTPWTDKSFKELVDRAEEGRPEGHWLKMRARPRRRHATPPSRREGTM